MQLSFSLNFRIVALIVILLPILLWLGNWQLKREDEKRAIQTTYSVRQEQTPVEFSDVRHRVTKTTDLAFFPVVLNGQFNPDQQFLLDNRINNGQVGYEVLTSFHVDAYNNETGSWVLVNRGWIKAPPLRSDLPVIPELPKDRVEIMGEIYVPPGEGYHLQDLDSNNTNWPKVVTAVDMEKMSVLLGEALFEYQIRIKPNQPGTLETNWAPINVSPEKHRAYAVQWFAMAAGLFVWLIFASISVRKPAQTSS